MERLFLIFLIYIIFGVVGPLLRRSQQRKKAQQEESVPTKKPERTQIKDVQAKFGKYLDQLQEAFKQQPTPPKLPEGEQQASKLLTISSKPEQNDQDEVLEFFPPPVSVSQARVQPRASRRPVSAARHKKSSSLLGFDKRRGYIQGVILSEILGPPVSKRPRGRRL